MLLRDVMHSIIDDGIEAARLSYPLPEQNLKLDGSIRGFEDCRDKQPIEIACLLIQAAARSQTARQENASDYWYWRCRELEIAWVANVLSAILWNQGEPGIIHPTARGLLKAAEIVGVKEPSREP